LLSAESAPNKQLQQTVMKTKPQFLFAVAVLGYSFAVSGQLRDDTRSLTKSDWQALLDEIGRVMPYVENNQVAGVRINQPGSLLTALGIDAGDVVVQLNGESLASVLGVQQFMVELAHAQSFELVVRSPTGTTRTVRCAERSTGCV